MSNFEFHAVYSAHTGEHVGGYVPHVEADSGIDVDGCDVLIDGVPDNLSEWDQIVGKTGQYGYRGAIMHASETADDETVLQWVRDAGADVFALVPVAVSHDLTDDGDDDECHAFGCDHGDAGWAIIYRAAA